MAGPARGDEDAGFELFDNSPRGSASSIDALATGLPTQNPEHDELRVDRTTSRSSMAYLWPARLKTTITSHTPRPILRLATWLNGPGVETPLPPLKSLLLRIRVGADLEARLIHSTHHLTSPYLLAILIPIYIIS